MKTKIETRNFSNLNIDSENRIIRGTAIVFDSESVDLGGFVEIIDRNAVTTEFLDKQDIIFKYNHNDNYLPLSRSRQGKGTLSYSIDERGVNFEFVIKNKDAGILESIQAGDIDSCSFSFICGQDEVSRRSDNTIVRKIKSFDKILDFSIVDTPAYPATSVSCRSIDEFKNKESEIKNKINVESFQSYYNKLKKKYL